MRPPESGRDPIAGVEIRIARKRFGDGVKAKFSLRHARRRAHGLSKVRLLEAALS